MFWSECIGPHADLSLCWPHVPLLKFPQHNSLFHIKCYQWKGRSRKPYQKLQLHYWINGDFDVRVHVLCWLCGRLITPLFWVHVCWYEHSDSSFVYGFMSLDYGLGTIATTTFGLLLYYIILYYIILYYIILYYIILYYIILYYIILQFLSILLLIRSTEKNIPRIHFIHAYLCLLWLLSWNTDFSIDR